jgi:ABC-type Co2+ transport system permease subunit
MNVSTWTWQRIAVAVIGAIFGLQLVVGIVRQFQSGFHPLDIVFFIVPAAISAGCVLYLFPMRRANGHRVLLSAGVGGAVLGLVGLIGGFVGPILFMPDANQGPLIGILVTGPLGLLLGAVGGALVGALAKTKPAKHHPYSRTSDDDDAT